MEKDSGNSTKMSMFEIDNMKNYKTDTTKKHQRKVDSFYNDEIAIENKSKATENIERNDLFSLEANDFIIDSYIHFHDLYIFKIHSVFTNMFVF